MTNIGEVVAVVVDPSHERFGQTGDIIFSGHMEGGPSALNFGDDEIVVLDDGRDATVPILPQFVPIRKVNESALTRLATQLPEAKPALLKLRQEVGPGTRRHTPETEKAYAGFVALLDSIISEPKHG